MCSGPKNPQILTFNHLNMIIILSLKIIADNNKKKKVDLIHYEPYTMSKI